MPKRPQPVRALLMLALGVALVLPAFLATPASGAAKAKGAGIEIIQINGLLDPPNAALIRDTIRDANRHNASVVVITMKSGGAVDIDPQPLVQAIRKSKVVVGIWVGPAGGKAKGAAALLAAAAPVVGVSNDSTIGPADPLRLDQPHATRQAALTNQMMALNESNGRDALGARAVVTHKLSSDEAVKTGATNRVCPQVPGCATLGDFIVNLDGRTFHTAAGAVRLSTAKVVGTGNARRRQPAPLVQFRKLDLVNEAVHTLTSPAIAYLLLVAGLALILFEFFTISIGLAGGVGALAVIGAFVGFSHLPVTWWALLLILLSMVGFGIDVQAGRAYAWTVIASVMLVAGSMFLYGGSSKLDVRWWELVLVVGLTILFMIWAMPVAVRSRFSTPTVGREGLVGAEGEAAVDVDPDGVVFINGARWRARTNRATPIRAGAPIRVVEVDGLVLEVEPPEGGARDYRERRSRHSADPDEGS
ncbi:MAG TPA: NfeD family protein [Acidimicrobiia bacterium]